MRIAIGFSASDIEAVRSLCVSERGRTAIARRQAQLDAPSPVTDADIWRSVIACLVTTQQRSGPGSRVERFCGTEPFPLSLGSCRGWGNALRENVAVVVSGAGLRRNTKIADACARNLPPLLDGGFDEIRRLLEELDRDHSPTRERAVAIHMQNFHEIGPKQSRNFLINLGRMRHELALDSRVLNWLRKHVVPSEARALFKQQLFGDEEYYCFMMDLIRRLCEGAGVLPSWLDAAAFDVGAAG